MDFKGMKWVGKVYQKFEAMCLEVEEIIVQDTAKYVENQVQTVGNTVKKFCSDVVQDLRPEPLPVSMLHEYDPVCSFKKKRESMNRKTRDVKQEQEVIEGKKDGCAMELRGIDADDYVVCTSPRQYRYGGPYLRTRIGHKQIFKKEKLLQDTRAFIQKDPSRTRVKNDVGTVNSSDSPPGVVERLISKEECQKDDRTENQHGLTVVNSVRSQDSEMRTDNEQFLTVVNSVKTQDSEMRTNHERVLTVVKSVISQDSEIRTEKEHGLRVINSVRSQDSEIQPSVATCLPAGSDDCRKETDVETNSTSVSEQRLETLQQLSGRSVDESCIIVDRDELHFVILEKENDKHKPYKKIREAISSRMKQNRENEYKRLARQWYAEDVENGSANPKPLEESEWELL